MTAEAATKRWLLFRFGRRLPGFNCKRLYSIEFRFESTNEIVSPVLEEHHEAESEEEK
jgi:hypothetical protein